MTILHIVGKPRSGKGVLMTFLSLSLADGGQLVDSNYHMNSPNVNFISFYDLLNFLKKPRVSPQHLLVIDELPGWCDSYVVQSKSSRYASHFVNQSQKLGYDLIFSSQRSMRADINYRELSDVRLKAEKVDGGFIYKVLDPEILDEDVETGQQITLPLELAKDYWNRFDTYEAVPPIGLDEAIFEMQKYDPAQQNQTINNLCNKLLECYPNVQFRNVNSVSDCLLELGLTGVFSGLILARLQRWQQTGKPNPPTATSPLGEKNTMQNRTAKWLQYQKK